MNGRQRTSVARRELIELSDRDLLAAHIAGSPAAIDTLLARHQGQMAAVARRTISDPEEAADALQDALLAVYRSAADFRGESEVSTWIHRIVVNACTSRLRRLQVRPAVPLLDDGDRLPIRREDPYAHREVTITLSDALWELTQEQFEAILLVDVAGYSHGEAAELLGAAEGTIKSRCARGKLRLAYHLRYLEEDPPAPATPTPCAEGYFVSRSRSGSRRRQRRSWNRLPLRPSGPATFPTEELPPLGAPSGPEREKR